MGCDSNGRDVGEREGMGEGEKTATERIYMEETVGKEKE